jgi:hypothetical protein
MTNMMNTAEARRFLPRKPGLSITYSRSALLIPSQPYRVNSFCRLIHGKSGVVNLRPAFFQAFLLNRGKLMM